MPRVVTDDTHPQFHLLEFEQVEAAPGTALLRVSGRADSELSGTLTLVIELDGQQKRHEQLPALPGPPDLIRAAFSAPIHDIAPGASFSLELPDGQVIGLPAPTHRRAALSGTPRHHDGASRSGGTTAEGEGEGDSSRLVEAERRAESRRLAIAELERRLQSERERRSAAESDLAHLRSERDDARAERDSALAERDEAMADRDRAEARARAAAANAGAMEAQIRAGTDSAARAQAALEVQLADRTAELDRIRSAAEVAQARAHATRRDVIALDEQLAHAQAQVTVLEQALEDREAAHAAAIESLEATLLAARSDNASAHERLTALEEEAESLRQLAGRFEGQQMYDLDAAQTQIDAVNAELAAIRAEGETLRHRNAELEATLAELDAALATRAAEIDLLRSALTNGGHPATAAGSGGATGSPSEIEARIAAARAEASTVLTAEVELLREQVRVHRNQFEKAESALRAAVTRAESAEIRGRELADALRMETERRVRADEALLEAEAQRRLRRF